VSIMSGYLKRMDLAAELADGDPARFRELFKLWVEDKIRADPTILRKSYWECLRR
jgi:hypothetical protein